MYLRDDPGGFQSEFKTSHTHTRARAHTLMLIKRGTDKVK
jgi:hypothetical protein